MFQKVSYCYIYVISNKFDKTPLLIDRRRPYMYMYMYIYIEHDRRS